MEQGWVYVLVNSTIPGLAKVGRTTRPPAERVAELSGATGVATPFVLAFDQAFADCVQAERDIHGELDRRGMRVASNREFFRGPPAEVVRVVLEVAARNDAGLPYVPEPSATEWLSDGDRFLFGMGDTLQDLSEALRCYRAAARRGSMVALERLGAVYSHVRGNTRADRRRAMRYLKEGAKRGNYYCYAELARMYAAEDHQANFVKAWDLFFSRRAQSLCDEVEAPSSESEAPETRYAHALRRYLVGCIGLGLVPLHVQELKDGAEPLVRCLAAALDIVRDAPEMRFRLAAALRWSYENLLPGQMAPQRTRWLLPAWFTLRRRVLA